MVVFILTVLLISCAMSGNSGKSVAGSSSGNGSSVVKLESDVNSVHMAHVVKLPEIFKFGNDFDLFFRQFTTYANAVSVEQAKRYNVMLSFLDKKSFNIVACVDLSESEKLNFDVALPKLKKAFCTSEIPASVELRFRKQLQNETLSDFGYAIQSLGFKAYGTDCLKHNSVIDAFCLGVTSANLSAKLLNKDFETLSEAISFAYKIESAANIRNFVEENRKVPQQVNSLQTDESGKPPDPVLQSQTSGFGKPPDSSVAENIPPEHKRLQTSTYGVGKPPTSERGTEPREKISDSENGKSVPISLINSSRPTPHERRCYYCGGGNHLIRSCFKRMSDERRNVKLRNKYDTADQKIDSLNSKSSNVPKSSTRFSTAFIPIKISDKHCYALVDTGASISLCCKSVLPSHVKISTQTSPRIRGVSGKELSVLGKATLNCNIGGKVVLMDVCVVENMFDSSFILGRDVIEGHQCVIDYRQLTFTIDNVTIPLLKTYAGKQLKSPSSLHCNRTTVIQPHSHKIIDCHMKNKSSKRLYLSMTGAVEMSKNVIKSHDICARDSLINSNRGKVPIMIHNLSDKPVCIYRNKKLGKFCTFHPVEINTLNDVHGLASEKHDKAKVGSNYSGNKSSSTSRKRWQNNIDELFSILKIDELTHLSRKQRDDVKKLISEFRDIFAENEDDMGCTDIAEQEIILKDHLPVRSKYYNIPLALRPKAEKEIKRLMDLGIIEPSTSSYHSPSFVMVKSDGSLRLLTDYRALNQKILRTQAPVPGLQDLVALWNNCTLFSTLDFQKGFFQTALKPESRQYTATSIPGIAFFQYCRSPMGLTNSPGFFQSLVEKILMGLKQSQCVAFLDDILSGSRDCDGMVDNLRAVFSRIRDSKMLLNSKKCVLFKKSIKYLGHIISDNGVAPCPEKVEAITKMVRPKNIKGIRSFLGLSGFYRRFVKNYAKIAEPLSKMTRKNAKFEWTNEADAAWCQIKDELAKKPILMHADPSKPYTLITDASSYAIGGILTQKGEDGHLHPISYGSSILTDAQRKWSTVQRELYSLVHFCEKYENYLLNTHFSVLCDNKALLHLDSFKNIKNDRLWRWFETLQKYDFTMTYVPSKGNPSDALSRLPRVNDKLIDTLPESAEVYRSQQKASEVIASFDDSVNMRPSVIFSSDKIRKAQEEDSVMRTVKSWIEDSSTLPTSSYNLRDDLYTYFHSKARLKVIDGVICREWEFNSNDKPLYLACIPKSLQNELIALAHDPPASGHLGADKTISRLRTTFYFPKMSIKVKLFVGKCHVCHKKRRNQAKLKAPLTPFAGTAPGEIVFMDLMENLPVVNGYKSILIIIDSFTKWCECIALRSTQAEYVARSLLNCWISRQGCPSQLHSDRGGNVETAEILKSLYKMLGITKTANVAYRPQTDGTAERMVGTLKTMLWKYCQENPRNWANCLDQVLFAYRTSVHSATGFAPFFLDKGRLPRLPLNIVMGTDVKDILGDNFSQAAYTLYHRLQDAYQSAHESIKTSQISSKKRYDSKVNVQSFVEGEWAYVWKPAPRDCDYKKFYDHFRGPYKIVKKMTDHQYRIKIGENKFDVVHMELMKSSSPPEHALNEEYDCGQDSSLIDPKFPNDKPPIDKVVSSPSPSEKLVINDKRDSESDDEFVLIRQPRMQRTPTQASQPRRSTRTRVQRIPYQHTG